MSGTAKLQLVEPQPVPALDWIAEHIESSLPYFERCPKHGVILAPGEECPICFTARFRPVSGGAA